MIKTFFTPVFITISLGAMLAGSGAFAQTPADKKLDDLEKQIQALKQAVEQLRPTPPSSSQPAPAATEVPSTNRTVNAGSGRRSNTNDPIARIRDEGMNRSELMATLSYLTEVIGPRLTGSPNLARANEWTRQKLSTWGLANAHLEPWGPFGRGWSLKRFSAQIIEPQAIPLAASPKAWTPGFEEPLVADVVYLDAKSEADLDKYKGKLKGAIVLASPVREVKARFEPLALRLMETNLLRLANSRDPRTSPRRLNSIVSTGGLAGRESSQGNAERRSRGSETNAAVETPRPAIDAPRIEGAPERRGPGGGGGSGRTNLSSGRILSFLAREGAGLVVTPSSQGDGGTLFVSSASVPGLDGRGGGGNAPRVWSTNAPAMPAQIAVAIEDYNRLVRMIQQGEKLTMAVDLQVQFYQDDLMAYNTIAEIPGSDLKDEIVMLGAHLDSWHSGTGATDNGAGVAATMESLRILTALKLQPRRTIRIGLWTGEEQGLLGSRAYVSQHFGYYTNSADLAAARTQTDENGNSPRTEPASGSPRSRRTLVAHQDHGKFSAYFNLDNGTGKIRGVYMQGNDGVRPLFRRWLEPFEDLGAETLTISNTGGTDHQSFDGVGLPGFQFIQDPIEYWSRTHHSNADVYDRIQADDLKQAAVIMAAFAYNAAMLDEKLPRKSAE